MSNADITVPHGFCHCGCGQRTSLATKTNTAEGRIKGQPCRFLSGHYARAERTDTPPNPSGLCGCGCGQRTPIAAKTSRAAMWIKGQPTRYVVGHQARMSSVDYVVDDAGCWVWQRGQRHGGYGSVHADGRTCFAHRVYYERYVGPIPDGLDLDHLCRNRLCVNPAHLEPVSATENVRRGAATKLVVDDVRAIRASTDSAKVLAKRFDVSPSTIWRVRSRDRWADID